MKENKTFDVAIIGAGPSGIFTAITLADAGLKVVLIDKSGNYYSRLKQEEKDLTGFGGAAMRYDANLDYMYGLPEKSNLGERVFGSKEVASRYIESVYSRLETFGLERDSKSKEIGGGTEDASGLEIVDRGILPIGEKVSNAILKNIYDYLVSKNVTFLEFTEVTGIEKNSIFEIQTKRSGKDELKIKARKVVIATGKLSIIPSRFIFDMLGVNYQVCDAIDLGIRVETGKRQADPITLSCVNQKIIYEKDGEITRTFCWCPGGRVIDYKFEGMSIIDGQHCHDKPTSLTNFGVVATIELPRDVDGTNLGINYIKTFNEYTKHKPGLQILKDFIEGEASSKEDIKANKIKPTLQGYSLVDLNKLLLFNLKDRILTLIDKINGSYPKAISDDSLLYGPVLERIFPKVDIDFNMETSVKGFFVVGDISGKAIGVITGAAMGIKAASQIIEMNK